MKPKTHQNFRSTEQKIQTQTDFSFALTKVAVSQICQSVGFKSAQLSALQTLTLVATKFLQAVATSAASFSRAANRTQSNLLDIVNALHDLSNVHGFPGGSSLHDHGNFCLLKSSVLTDLSRFVNYTDEIPFAKPIPRNSFGFPRNPNPPGKLACLDGGVGIPRGLHIPDWLPALPECKNRECEKVACERLWENSISVGKNGGAVDGNGRELVCGELGEGRERVRFRVGARGEVGSGIGMRNGVCKGGKRVCFSNGRMIGEEEKKVNDKKSAAEVKSGLKRKRRR